MPKLVLNALEVDFSPSVIAAREKPFHSTHEVRALRGQFGAEWVFRFDEHRIYALPRVDRPSTVFGEPGELRIADHPHLAAALLDEALPRVFESYKPLYDRPLAILSRRPTEERVARAAATCGIAHPMLPGFSVRPKLEISTRVIASGGRLRTVILLELSSRWEISVSIVDLVASGVDVSGLCVVRREPAPDERRLVGRVGRLECNDVVLSESYSAGPNSVSVGDVLLEGRREAFERCLSTLCGAEAWGRLDHEIRSLTDREGGGAQLRQGFRRIAEHLRKQGQICLPGGLVATIGKSVELSLQAGSGVNVGPVEYCFDAAKTKRNVDPWRGLRSFGPYSRDTLRQQAPRILVLCDAAERLRVEQFVKALQDGLPSAGPVFEAGFGDLFRLAGTRFEVVTLALSGVTRENAGVRYRDEVQRVLRREPRPAATLLVLDDRVADLPDGQNPYLFARAALLMAGIPVQALRLSRVRRSDRDLQYILQNLSIALYAKLEGTPWSVVHDPTLTDELVIGIGTAELSGSRFEERQRVVGITTVFRGDGNYLVGHLSEECSYADYPRMLRASTLRVLAEVRSKNNWMKGDRIRVIFHSWKPLKQVEVADIVAAAVREVGSDLALEFAVLTVSLDHPFSVLDLAQSGQSRGGSAARGEYVPRRGTILRISDEEHLVCVQGPELMKRADQPLPSPLLVRLHRNHGLDRTDLWYLAEQVLKFTSLSWKSKLPAPLPATIYYSKLIAEQLGRLRAVPGWSPLALNTVLPESKWFL